MWGRQVTAILLSAVLAVSACMPMSSMTVFAAEDATGGSTKAAFEAAEPDETEVSEKSAISEDGFSENEDDEQKDPKEAVEEAGVEEGLSFSTDSTDEDNAVQETAESAELAGETVQRDESLDKDGETAVEKPALTENDSDTMSDEQSDMVEEEVAEEEQNATRKSIENEYICIVTFDANGGYFDNQKSKTTTQVGIASSKYSYDLNDICDAITPPDGMVFLGWNKDQEANNGNKKIYADEVSQGDVYYAIWVTVCAITLDANGGYFNNDPTVTLISETVAKGESFPIYNYDNAVTCEGKALIGWDTDRLSDNPSKKQGNYAKVYPEADVTYYAIWAEAVTVTLDPNGGRFTTYDEDEWDYVDLDDEFVSISVSKGARCELSNNKVRREGYLFDDWYVKSTGKRYTIDGYSSTEIYEDTELIAKWKKACKVTFDPNGGSYGNRSYLPGDYKYWLNKGEKYVEEGSTTSPFSWDSDLPEYEGSELIGWSLEKGGSLVDVREVTINKDTTFYAVWREEGSAETCTVTFNLNGGTIDGKTEYKKEVDKNETIGWVSVPRNEDDTLTFGYWYVLQEGKENRIDNIRDYKVTQDITVYAKWVDTVTVTIDAGDGYILTYGEGYSHTKSYIAAKGEPFSPLKNRNFLVDYGGGRYIDHLFDGLYEDKGFTREADLSSADNMTLYVKFKPYYVVTLHGNGGQFTGHYDITTYGESTDETIQLIYIPGFDSVQLIREKKIAMYMGSGLFAIEEPGSYLVNNDGTIFGGWYYDPECTEFAGYYQDIAVYGDIDLYAGYDNAKICTVTFDVGAGKLIEGTSSHDVYENGLISSTEKVEAPEGKIFTGWYLDQACSEEDRIADVSNHVFTKDTTLYAGYADKDDVVTVKLDPNGGTYSRWFDTQNIAVVKGQSLVNVDIPENDERLFFAGWYRDQDCTQLIPDISRLYPDEDCTLYAGWEDGVRVTIVYDDGDTLTEYVQKNQPIGNLEDSFISEIEKEDEIIIGYSVNEDLTGKFYSIKEMKSLPITEETTFYAVQNVARKVTVINYIDKQEHSKGTLYVADKKLGDYTYTAYIDGGKYSFDFIDTIKYRFDICNGNVLEGAYANVSMSEADRITDVSNYDLESDVTLYMNWTEGFPVKLVANGGYIESQNLAVYRLASPNQLEDWIRIAAEKAAVNSLYVAKGSNVNPDGSIHVYHEDGLELEGWYFDKACTKLATKDLTSFTVNKAMVLYAKWKKICKHDWNDTYTVDKEATCSEEGSESIHCSVCGEIKEGSARVIEKLDHTYGEWETVKDATCTESGSHKKTCSACGDEVTEEIPAKGHTWNKDYTVDKEPTNSEDGLKSIHCSVCDSVKEGSEVSIPRLSKELSGLPITGIVNKACTGKVITQDIVIKDGAKTLIQNTDYTVSYENNVNVGTATVTITGAGSYTGTVTKTFMILPGKTTRGDMFNLANNVKVTWKEVPGAKYYKVYREGVTDKKETRKDPVIVTDRPIGWDKDPGLTNGHAYRYKIVASLTGKGDSSGDSTLSYSKLMYRLKTVVIRSVKNTAPGKVTVKYDKTTSGDSYVLQYCERQDMVGAKTKVVLGASNTSYVIGGLKKGRTYYISIRVRKKVNGIDYYTTFGVPKKVTVTK